MIPLHLLTKLKILTPMLKLSAIRVISKTVLRYPKATNVKRGPRNQTQKEVHQLREICTDGFCACGRNTMGC